MVIVVGVVGVVIVVVQVLVVAVGVVGVVGVVVVVVVVVAVVVVPVLVVVKPKTTKRKSRARCPWWRSRGRNGVLGALEELLRCLWGLLGGFLEVSVET